MLAASIRLGLERLDATVVIGHVRTVHRAQRHAHRLCNRRLRHPTLAQQHHLDALTMRGCNLPSQRCFQPPDLGFAALDHLFLPNQMVTANHTSSPENNSRSSSAPPPQNFDSTGYGGGITWVKPRPCVNHRYVSFRQLLTYQ